MSEYRQVEPTIIEFDATISVEGDDAEKVAHRILEMMLNNDIACSLHKAGTLNTAAPKSDDGPAYLPKITEQILDDFGPATLLIEPTDETESEWNWTQDAVDFANLLNQHRLPKPDDERDKRIAELYALGAALREVIQEAKENPGGQPREMHAILAKHKESEDG